MFLYDFDAEETNLCEEDDEDEDEDEDEEPKSSTEQKEAAMVKELRSKGFSYSSLLAFACLLAVSPRLFYILV